MPLKSSTPAIHISVLCTRCSPTCAASARSRHVQTRVRSVRTTRVPYGRRAYRTEGARTVRTRVRTVRRARVPYGGRAYRTDDARTVRRARVPYGGGCAPYGERAYRTKEGAHCTECARTVRRRVRTVRTTRAPYGGRAYRTEEVLLTHRTDDARSVPMLSAPYGRPPCRTAPSRTSPPPTSGGAGCPAPRLSDVTGAASAHFDAPPDASLAAGPRPAQVTKCSMSSR